MSELAEEFADLDDPRAANARRHSLHDILIIALCTGMRRSDLHRHGTLWPRQTGVSAIIS